MALAIGKLQVTRLSAKCSLHAMTLPSLLVDVALGFAIGITLGLLGGGGSILTVPALVRCRR